MDASGAMTGTRALPAGVVLQIALFGPSGAGKTTLITQMYHMRHSKHPKPREPLRDIRSTSTIGADYKNYDVHDGGALYKLQFWDTAGQERFATIARSYLRGACCVVLVLDVLEMIKQAQSSASLGEQALAGGHYAARAANTKAQPQTAHERIIAALTPHLDTIKNDARPRLSALADGALCIVVLNKIDVLRPSDADLTSDVARLSAERIAAAELVRDTAKALAQQYGYAYMETCASDGTGVREVMDWVVDALVTAYKSSRPMAVAPTRAVRLDAPPPAEEDAAWCGC